MGFMAIIHVDGHPHEISRTPKMVCDEDGNSFPSGFFDYKVTLYGRSFDFCEFARKGEAHCSYGGTLFTEIKTWAKAHGVKVTRRD